MKIAKMRFLAFYAAFLVKKHSFVFKLKYIYGDILESFALVL